MLLRVENVGCNTHVVPLDNRRDGVTVVKVAVDIFQQEKLIANFTLFAVVHF